MEAVGNLSQPLTDKSDAFLHAYPASKVLSKRAAWKFVKEEKPGFVLNSVIPAFIIGSSLDPVNQGYQSSVGMVAAMFNGEAEWMKRLGTRKPPGMLLIYSPD